jgi:hypothetical protein
MQIEISGQVKFLWAEPRKSSLNKKFDHMACLKGEKSHDTIHQSLGGNDSNLLTRIDLRVNQVLQ